MPLRASDTSAAAAAGLTLAVIGHVNHGKTALVRALTGMETDRLKEEIERGLSITLGFAWRGGVDLIDAPGHEDFIRAMVSGASGARAVLLVVSAVEGIGRQTREHLQIAGLLGIRCGVVAVTKADLLAPDDEAEACARVAAGLRGSILEGEPLVLCSATSGRGLDVLHQALDALAARSPPPSRLNGAFLPIDRAFTIAGVGTVVTGTLQGGGLATGDEAVLQPSGRRVSLRQIEVHGAARDTVEPGGRVAVNLRGVPAETVRAGDALCAPGCFEAALQVDVEVSVSAGAARAVKHLDEVRVLWGARHDMASVRLLGERAIAPGGRGLAQLRFAAPVIAFSGQRAILRRPSPAETIAGAIVLDPRAPPSRGKAAERVAVLQAAAAGDLAAVATALARQGGGLLSIAEAARLSRRDAPDVRRSLERDFEDLDGARLTLRSASAAATQAYLGRVSEAHRLAPARFTAAAGPIRAQLARQFPADLVGHVERALAAAGEIRLEGAQVALAGHDPLAMLSADAADRLAALEADLMSGGLMPPDVAVLAGRAVDGGDLVGLLTQSGRAVSLRNGALRQTLVFHRDALDAAFLALRAAFPPPHAFTTGEARAALQTTRKFIVPVLEYFDAQNLTRRQGDVRQVIAPPPA